MLGDGLGEELNLVDLMVRVRVLRNQDHDLHVLSQVMDDNCFNHFPLELNFLCLNCKVVIVFSGLYAILRL